MHPSKFYPDLSDDRLQIVAAKLLDIRFSTLQEMNSPFDDNYTRETVVFGRSRNMLIVLALSQKHKWLSLSHAAMDITFNIGGVPCRFFRDDPNNPEKIGFFKRNDVDGLFAKDEQYPVMWRFVIEKALSDEDEDQVFFVGYNVYHEKVSEWIYRPTASMLHSVDHDVPTAAEILPAHVDVREDTSVDQESNSILKAINKANDL